MITGDIKHLEDYKKQFDEFIFEVKDVEEKYYLKSNRDIITTYKKYDNYYKSITEAKDKNSIYYFNSKKEIF